MSRFGTSPRFPGREGLTTPTRTSPRLPANARKFKPSGEIPRDDSSSDESKRSTLKPTQKTSVPVTNTEKSGDASKIERSLNKPSSKGLLGDLPPLKKAPALLQSEKLEVKKKKSTEPSAKSPRGTTQKSKLQSSNKGLHKSELTKLSKSTPSTIGKASPKTATFGYKTNNKKTSASNSLKTNAKEHSKSSAKRKTANTLDSEIAKLLGETTDSKESTSDSDEVKITAPEATSKLTQQKLANTFESDIAKLLGETANCDASTGSDTSLRTPSDSDDGKPGNNDAKPETPIVKYKRQTDAKDATSGKSVESNSSESSFPGDVIDILDQTDTKKTTVDKVAESDVFTKVEVASPHESDEHGVSSKVGDVCLKANISEKLSSITQVLLDLPVRQAGNDMEDVKKDHLMSLSLEMPHLLGDSTDNEDATTESSEDDQDEDHSRHVKFARKLCQVKVVSRWMNVAASDSETEKAGPSTSAANLNLPSFEYEPEEDDYSSSFESDSERDGSGDEKTDPVIMAKNVVDVNAPLTSQAVAKVQDSTYNPKVGTDDTNDNTLKDSRRFSVKRNTKVEDDPLLDDLDNLLSAAEADIQKEETHQTAVNQSGNPTSMINTKTDQTTAGNQSDATRNAGVGKKKDDVPARNDMLKEGVKDREDSTTSNGDGYRKAILPKAGSMEDSHVLPEASSGEYGRLTSLPLKKLQPIDPLTSTSLKKSKLPPVRKQLASSEGLKKSKAFGKDNVTLIVTATDDPDDKDPSDCPRDTKTVDSKSKTNETIKRKEDEKSSSDEQIFLPKCHRRARMKLFRAVVQGFEDENNDNNKGIPSGQEPLVSSNVVSTSQDNSPVVYVDSRMKSDEGVKNSEELSVDDVMAKSKEIDIQSQFAHLAEVSKERRVSVNSEEEEDTVYKEKNAQLNATDSAALAEVHKEGCVSANGEEDTVYKENNAQLNANEVAALAEVHKEGRLSINSDENDTVDEVVDGELDAIDDCLSFTDNEFSDEELTDGGNKPGMLDDEIEKRRESLKQLQEQLESCQSRRIMLESDPDLLYKERMAQADNTRTSAKQDIKPDTPATSTEIEIEDMASSASPGVQMSLENQHLRETNNRLVKEKEEIQKELDALKNKGEEPTDKAGHDQEKEYYDKIDVLEESLDFYKTVLAQARDDKERAEKHALDVAFELKSSAEKVDNLQRQLEERETETGTTAKKMERLEQENVAKQDKLSALNKQIDVIKKVASQKVGHLESQLKDLEGTETKHKQEVELLSSEVSKQEKENTELRKTVANLKRQQNEVACKSEQKALDLQKEVNNLTKALEELNSKSDEKEQQLKKSTSEIEVIKKESAEKLSELRNQLNERSDSELELKAKLQELDSQVTDLQSEKISLTMNLQEGKICHALAASDLENVRQINENLVKTNTHLKAAIKALNDKIDDKDSLIIERNAFALTLEKQVTILNQEMEHLKCTAKQTATQLEDKASQKGTVVSDLENVRLVNEDLVETNVHLKAQIKALSEKIENKDSLIKERSEFALILEKQVTILNQEMEHLKCTVKQTEKHLEDKASQTVTLEKERSGDSRVELRHASNHGAFSVDERLRRKSYIHKVVQCTESVIPQTFGTVFAETMKERYEAEKQKRIAVEVQVKNLEKELRQAKSEGNKIIESWSQNVVCLEEKLGSSTASEEQLTKELGVIRGTIAQLTAEKANQEENIAELTIQLQNARNTGFELLNTNSGLTEKIFKLQEDVYALQEKCAKLVRENCGLEETAEELKQQLEDTNEVVAELRQSNSKLREWLSHVKENTEMMQTHTVALQDRCTELMKEKSDLEKADDQLRQEKEEAEDTGAHLRQQNSELKDQMCKLQKELSTQKEEHSVVLNEKSTLENALDHLKQQLSDHEDRAVLVEQANCQLKENINKMQQNLDIVGEERLKLVTDQCALENIIEDLKKQLRDSKDCAKLRDQTISDKVEEQKKEQTCLVVERPEPEETNGVLEGQEEADAHVQQANSAVTDGICHQQEHPISDECSKMRELVLDLNNKGDQLTHELDDMRRKLKDQSARVLHNKKLTASLKRQREKVKILREEVTYLNTMNEKKEAEWEGLKCEISASHDLVNRMERELGEYKSEMVAMAMSNKEIQQQCDGLLTEKADLQERINFLTAEIESHRKDHLEKDQLSHKKETLLQEKLTGLCEEKRKYQTDIQRVHNQLGGAKRTIRELTDQLTEMSTKRQQDDLVMVKINRENEHSNQKIDELTKELKNRSQDATDLRTEKRIIAVEISNLRARCSESAKQAEEMTAANAEAQTKIDGLKEKLSRLNTQCQVDDVKLESFEEEISVVKARARELNEELQKCSQNKASLEDQITSLTQQNSRLCARDNEHEGMIDGLKNEIIRVERNNHILKHENAELTEDMKSLYAQRREMGAYMETLKFDHEKVLRNMELTRTDVRQLKDEANRLKIAIDDQRRDFELRLSESARSAQDAQESLQRDKLKFKRAMAAITVTNQTLETEKDELTEKLNKSEAELKKMTDKASEFRAKVELAKQIVEKQNDQAKITEKQCKELKNDRLSLKRSSKQIIEDLKNEAWTHEREKRACEKQLREEARKYDLLNIANMELENKVQDLTTTLRVTEDQVMDLNKRLYEAENKRPSVYDEHNVTSRVSHIYDVSRFHKPVKAELRFI